MIYSMLGDAPSITYNCSWEEFIDTCELLEIFDGVGHYKNVNCNYIVFPDGLLIENYGFHGDVLMDKIRQMGVEESYKELKKTQNKYMEI